VIEAFAEGCPGAAVAAAQGPVAEWHAVIGPMLADAERGRFRPELAPTMAKLADDYARVLVSGAAEAEDADLASKDVANRTAAALMFRLLSVKYRQMLRDQARRAYALGVIDAIARAEAQAAAGVQLPFAMEVLGTALVRPER
jgi:hypothetical protein